MNSDSAFYIGKTHHVCQDYAAHGISKRGMPFAVISDGCSSSPDTDFGSRLLVKSCANLYKNILGYYNSDHIIVEASAHAAEIRLPDTATDATLLTVEKLNEEDFSISCAGDGVIAKIKKDGTIDVTEITYESGAPYYLNYLLSPERNEGYKNKFGLKRTVKKYSIINGIQSLIFTAIDELGSIYFEEDRIRDYVTLAVMSDGILSYQQTALTSTSKVNVPVESYKVLNELLSFKNYNGVFVQRRFQRFRKDCEDRGWFSLDDVSIGAIYLE